MMLNLAKCAFGVGSGKFLGLMVSKRGIEANPDKIKSIVDMEPPHSVKDVQKLTGRVAALGSQEAFEALKKYLTEAPLLAKPKPGETLYLYLEVSNTALGAVLVKEKSKVQKPIYYVSKILHRAEINYSLIEKFALALIMALRKLCPYFQAHKIEVLTDQPLRNILHSPKLIRWLMPRIYVKKCDKCQRHASVVRQPLEMFTSINSPIPFALWGMGILGPLPVTSGQRKFLIVAIDYFTRRNLRPR
ncbi:hypothetical protein POM88_040652 [Heracleum sosnowskyi]|uniref:Reverse transcriptase/retrotransposon-derived protein RNase H-like domain-containing protein n=1 Tax=Heracleum sosnowskyi TaxID=360622 RepID=A0AAD8HDK3_9APIA|nr:hypothetical protein POM88_040652 [Heracleum sosnowskyi]